VDAGRPDAEAGLGQGVVALHPPDPLELDGADLLPIADGAGEPYADLGILLGGVGVLRDLPGLALGRALLEIADVLLVDRLAEHARDEGRRRCEAESPEGEDEGAGRRAHSAEPGRYTDALRKGQARVSSDTSA